MARRTPEQIAAYKAARYAALKAQDPVAFRAKLTARNKAWRQAHPERAAEFCRKWRKAHPEKHKARWAAYYEANKEALRARAREYAAATVDRKKARFAALDAIDPSARATRRRNWVKARPDKALLRSARKNAKMKGVAFNLELADIVVPTHCPVFGTELTPGGGRLCQTAPSIDRIVPALGYVRGNIIIVSWEANRLKNNASIDKLRKLAAFYSQFKQA